MIYEVKLLQSERNYTVIGIMRERKRERKKKNVQTHLKNFRTALALGIASCPEKFISISQF